jgi:hypothetical protein
MYYSWGEKTNEMARSGMTSDPENSFHHSVELLEIQKRPMFSDESKPAESVDS